MRKLQSAAFFAALFAISISTADMASAEEGEWFGQTGVVLLKRESNPDSTLVVSSLTGAEEMNAKDFKFDTEAGLDVSIGYWCDDEIQIFVRHFNVNDHGDGHYTNGIESHIATSPTIGEVAPVATDISGYYQTALWSTELNLMHTSNSWLSCLVGFRWIELHEDLKIKTRSMNGTTYFKNNTRNHLYGLQIGGDGLLYSSDKLSINGVLKGGLYGAVGNTHSYYRRGNLILTREGGDNDLAFVGEASINFAYQVNQLVSFQAGYQLLWLTGVALSGEQVPVTSFNNNTAANFDNDATLFYHGAFVNCIVTY